MSRRVKIILYVVLTACVITFGVLAGRAYKKVGGPRSEAVLNNPETPAAKSENSGNWALYGALAFLSVVGLGILVARDISHLVATRVEDFVFNDNLEGVRNPEYE